MKKLVEQLTRSMTNHSLVSNFLKMLIETTLAMDFIEMDTILAYYHYKLAELIHAWNPSARNDALFYVNKAIEVLDPSSL